jgi:hypothetical protein
MSANDRPRGLERAAQLGIVVELIALIRCLGEYYRLKYVRGPAFDPLQAEPFILGALVAALFCLTSVLAYFRGALRLCFSLAIAMVSALLVLKIVLIGS